MRRLRDVLALVACLAVVAGISLLTGDRAEQVPVRYEDVAVGERGVARQFDATVLDVQLTQQILRDSSSEPLVSTSTFVVVTLTADARTDSLGLGNIRLVTADGDRYVARSEAFSAAPPMASPGFTTTGTLVFQVPSDDVPGAQLLVVPDSEQFLAHDTTIRVELALTAGSPVAGPIELTPGTTAVTP